MADSRAGVFFGIVVVVAAAGVGWLALSRRAPDTPPAPPAGGTTSGVPGKGPGAAQGKGKKVPKPPKAPLPPEEPIPATKEGCTTLLRRLAGPAAPPPSGGMVLLFPAVRMDAMEALLALDPQAGEAAVLAALGGDGDPGDWSEERMHAAALRLRAGKADGAEAVKAFLALGKEMADADGLGRAAAAASWMDPAEGGNAIRRMLALPPDDLDEEHLEEILRAAAVLGNGAGVEELRKLATAWEGDPGVPAAAAGALKKLGDDAGKSLLAAQVEDDWFDGQELARGLGARGNSGVLPWLEQMTAVEDEWTAAAAARSMRVVGDRAAVPALRKALSHEGSDVQAEAAISLAALGEKDALGRVRAALEDRDPEIRAAAWRAVFEAGDAESKAAAVKLLGVGAPNQRDPRHGAEMQARVWAAALLLRAGVE